jgi:hypothetical protein
VQEKRARSSGLGSAEYALKTVLTKIRIVMKYSIGTKFKTVNNRIATIVATEICPSKLSGDLVLYDIQLQSYRRSDSVLMSEQVLESYIRNGRYTKITN